MLDERWVRQFLEQVRVENREHGIHALYRILPGNTPKLDKFTLSTRGARNPLIG